jgi:hypothetical protein
MVASVSPAQTQAEGAIESGARAAEESIVVSPRARRENATAEMVETSARADRP